MLRVAFVTRWTGFVLILCPLFPGIALSAEADPPPLSPITITIEKGNEPLATLPASVIARSGRQLKDNDTRTLNDAGRQAANLHVMGQGGAGRSNYLFMRGVGSNNNEPAIAVLVDDVPLTNEGLYDQDLSEAEQMEVVRGPQGTLHGRGSLGGMIHVTNRKPEPVPDVEAEVSTGTLNSQKQRFRLQTPVGESRQLAMSLSANRETRDGHMVNLLTGNDVESFQKNRAHLRLNWRPDPQWEADLALRQDESDVGGFGLNPPENLRRHPGHVELNHDGRSRREEDHLTLRLDRRGEKVHLTSITGLGTWDNRAIADGDYSPTRLSRVWMDEEQRFRSQEIRLAQTVRQRRQPSLLGLAWSEEAFDRRIDIFYEQDAVNAGLIPFLMNDVTDARIRTEQRAIFGQAVIPLPLRFEWTLGLRREQVEKSLTGMRRMETAAGQEIAGTYNELGRRFHEGVWLPRSTLAWQATSNAMVYATLADGYRGGGFNLSATDARDHLFRSEKGRNHEIGTKIDWLGGRLRTHGALFLVKTSNQQVEQLLPNFAPVTRNAGEVRSRGGEMDLALVPWKGGETGLQYGYTDARFLHFDDPVRGVNYAGRRVPIAPRHTAQAYLQHRFEPMEGYGLQLRGEVEGMGDLYWDSANTMNQDYYNLFNLQARIDHKPWDFTLSVRNVMDEKYDAYGLTSPTSGPRILEGSPRLAMATVQWHGW